MGARERRNLPAEAGLHHDRWVTYVARWGSDLEAASTVSRARQHLRHVAAGLLVLSMLVLDGGAGVTVAPGGLTGQTQARGFDPACPPSATDAQTWMNS